VSILPDTAFLENTHDEGKRMKVFKDNKGRPWTIDITVGTIKRVKDLLGINLIDAVSSDLLEKLKSDPVLLCDILYAICKPEADKQGITDIEFGEGLAGDAIEHATEALIEDLVNFFPSRQRTMLQSALAKIDKAEKQMMDAAMAKFDKELDKEIEAKVTDFLNSFGKSAAN